MAIADRAQKMRELAVLIEAGLSSREIAPRLGVSIATAIRWTRRAGLVSHRSRRLSQETRAAISEAARDGVSTTEAAARFGVCAETVQRISGRPKRNGEQLRRQVQEAVASGLSRREAALRAGVSAATAIRWARGHEGRKGGLGEQAELFDAEATKRRPPRRDAREEQRTRLLAAVASGLSRRRAAALVGLPVATAIRWVGRAK